MDFIDRSLFISAFGLRNFCLTLFLLLLFERCLLILLINHLSLVFFFLLLLCLVSELPALVLKVLN